MGLIKKAIGLVLLLLLLWGAYVAYAALTVSPQLSAHWGTVNESVTNIIITGKWDKPLLVPIEIQAITVNFTGIEVAKILEFNYSPTETSARTVVGIDNRKLIKALVNYFNNGQRGIATIALEGKLLRIIHLNPNPKKEEINEDILGRLNFTAESKELARGLVKTPALVETTFDWAGERDGKAVIIAHMKFYNPNGFPIPVGNVSFDAYANGIKTGYGRTIKEAVIPANGYATIDVETYIEEDSLPKVWEIHVKNGEVSKVRADIFLDLNVMDQRYSVKLASYEETVQTDIMGELNRMLGDMLG